jgi:hypothetical protein
MAHATLAYILELNLRFMYLNDELLGTIMGNIRGKINRETMGVRGRGIYINLEPCPSGKSIQIFLKRMPNIVLLSHSLSI